MSGVVMSALIAGHAMLVFAALVLAVPVGVLALEVSAGRRARSACSAVGNTPAANAAAPAMPAAEREPRIAVLMPAHDEAAGIADPLASVRAQLGPSDRVLVVADNCSDDTARVARAAGAQVVERIDPTRRGKGYALDFGVRSLAEDPPDIVIVVDADCLVTPGTLAALARRCVALRRPVQALYLMQAPAGAGLGTRIAAFAWLLRNQLRPLGAASLGWPCQLMGTGMAFPWAVIERAPLASGHLVEDLELGLVLAAHGMPPSFGADALVTSTFPLAGEALASQRTRWEHGHLAVIAGLAPRLIVEALRRRSAALLAMLLDVCVPPVAALILLLAIVFLLAVPTALAGAGSVALAIASFEGLTLAATLVAAWRAVGRDLMAPRELLALPGYILGKIGLYRRAFGRRQREWVRTRRDDGNA
jgi:cellulose synthase/poly-beta-1,6-N-acetylglucosamine synthase-like glycosyltransferase